MLKLHYPYHHFAADVDQLVKTAIQDPHPFDGVYGVPRGGIPLALALSKAIANLPLVTDAGQVTPNTLVVDDIIDSGATRERWIDNVFIALHGRPGKRQFGTIVLHETPDWVVYWWEKDEVDSIADSVTRQLQFIGEDPCREGLVDTPARVVKSWAALYGGYDQDPADLMRTFVEGSCDEMVVLKDIELFSTCEHHLLPFYGKAHIAYIPDGKVIGVSKLARLLDMYARRAQIQERIGQQVTDALMTHLKPRGAACIIEAQHLCMKARGVQKQNSIMVTSSLTGVFRDSAASRAELMGLIK